MSILKPDFKKYSLAMLKDGKMVFSSKKEGIMPLVECVRECFDGYSENKCDYKDCILHDKVVGLAAARLIIFSGRIKTVCTDLCSKPAKELLEKNKIELQSKKIVDRILNKDKSGMCMMEMKAMEIKDNSIFFSELSRLFPKC